LAVDDHKKRFGRARRLWRNRNGLSQLDSDQWAKLTPAGQRYQGGEGESVLNAQEQGWECAGPYCSQESKLENGVLDPKGAALWIALGCWNWAIANDQVKGLPSKLAQKMKAAQPFLTPTGAVADAQDFFAYFAGLADIREEYLAAEVAAGPLTDAEAERVNAWLVEFFADSAAADDLSPQQAWEALRQIMPPLSKADQQKISLALVGLQPLTAVDLSGSTALGLSHLLSALKGWSTLQSKTIEQIR